MEVSKVQNADNCERRTLRHTLHTAQSKQHTAKSTHLIPDVEWSGQRVTELDHAVLCVRQAAGDIVGGLVGGDGVRLVTCLGSKEAQCTGYTEV